MPNPAKSLFSGFLPRLVVAVFGLYLLAAVIVGMYWSREPAPFAVTAPQPALLGEATVSTLVKVASTLLDKPGGFLANDWAPPGLWLDNMPSWEYGALVQVRDLSRALRKDFSRSQSQSTENVDLARAEPLFNFDHKSWIMPSAESEYRKAIDSLERFLNQLKNPQGDARFYARADSLANWLGDVSTRLGSLSQRLSASIGRERLDTDHNPNENTADAAEIRVQTPWLQIDNVFYEARGQAWALSHMLRAIELDFADVLSKKNAAVSLRQIIRELDAAQETLFSPMVLNGSGYGILANHSLVMANYISRANAALIDLRQLLTQG
ncbi:hypothetical protein AXE65_02995 [Ventosimonas gracilis]|uniref:DUF2333 domain-containing protein n=1 Tax=Ventosimonas gracilis TaxID=1680762 RepID=A0A139SSU4_9GAMM|nr:DUF2333 family protein [Ventosimonas gracilis]KXU37572.1 hypothetical protein AXE65_02995 [Ventosimonas gracilis]